MNLELVLIPAGEFLMGTPDTESVIVTSDSPMGALYSAFGIRGGWDLTENEKPQHRVRITKLFYLGKYKVTQEQWEAVMGTNPSMCKGPKNPVDNVSWNDCQDFLGKLNLKSTGHGGKFVLPTEAQWEYACRAGSTTRYCFGDNPAQLGDFACCGKNCDRKNIPVGQKKPNAWGLYDMHGPVQEWCADLYGPYHASAVDDPTGPSAGWRAWRAAVFVFLTTVVAVRHSAMVSRAR